MAVSIFNEKNYLLNPEVLDNFYEMHDDKKKRWDAERSVLGDKIELYDEFINEVAQLLHQLGFSSTLECSLMVSYLIKEGYFSSDKKFKKGSPDDKQELSYKLGTSIVRGQGCCRNYTEFLKDVFRILNIPTDNLYCYQGLVKMGINKPANHVISLIKHQDGIYGIDLYNGNRLYRFKTPVILSELSTETSYKLLYKPYYEIVMGESDLRGIMDRIKRFQDYSEEHFISPFEYEYERDKVKERMESLECYLDRFHQNTKTLKYEIKRVIDSQYRT